MGKKIWNQRKSRLSTINEKAHNINEHHESTFLYECRNKLLVESGMRQSSLCKSREKKKLDKKSQHLKGIYFSRELNEKLPCGIYSGLLQGQ